MATQAVCVQAYATLTTQRRFAFIFNTYRTDVYFYESIAMIRKSSIVFASVLLTSSMWQVR